MELAAGERWAHAIEAFESALELRQAPAIRYNLAAALVESGRYRDAHEQLLALEADADTPENLAALSQTLREQLATEAGHLAIERPPALADTEVVLDTLPVAEAVVHSSIPVRPGEHRIAATRGNEMLAAVTVMAPAGELTRVLLRPEPEVMSDTDTTLPLTSEPIFWLSVTAAAVVVIVAVVVVAVLASSGEEPVPGNFSPAIVTWP